ncbi:MAG TPA: alpha/beta fold hydrolase [Solirubrobacteraceae bacterium]|nr:alpha/beta fold hydrolase [Solirubrobacteraceae bacterium]
MSADPAPFSAEHDGVAISGEQSGEGAPVVLLHGLTATRRYVVMGSRSLERSGHRVISYDARGHGASAPAGAPAEYTYELLGGDLEAVLDAAGVRRAVLAGASMGAHTAVRFALEHPERVAALALITPAFDPSQPSDAEELARWDALAEGLRAGGVEGFVKAYDLDAVPDRWRETIAKVLRQRLSAHEHPEAVADALQAVPRSRPFESLDELAGIEAPVLVVASRDEADPGHPLNIGERYARAIPAARLVVEDAGPPIPSPIAWQGGALSELLAELTASART